MPRARPSPPATGALESDMEFLSEYAMFLAKSVTVLVAVLVAAGGLVALSARGAGAKPRERIEVRSLNERYRDMARSLNTAMMTAHDAKRARRRDKKQRKVEQKRRSAQTERRGRVFVLDFQGDLRASAVAALREEVTAIVTAAGAGDEVLVRLESAGGLVHGYGLAASQLQRLRQREIPLTVAVDKVAASGGYMMACVADRVIAAPFAIVGSIGVLTQLPNFHRLLRKHDIDFELIMAGEHKRTLTLFGENTDSAREKLRTEIEDLHELFKSFVSTHRPVVDLARVATGEHWHGTRALELKLVDELRTSDDFLLEASERADLYELHYLSRKSLAARLRTFGAQLRPHPAAAESLGPPTMLL